jgi:hypothetical protein
MFQNLKELHDKNNLPNLLLYGNNLFGKNTLCEIFCNINNLNIIYKSLAVNNSNNNKFNNKLALIIKNLDNAIKDINDNSKNILLINYSSLIYNKGISANNLLEYFTNCSNFKSDFLQFVFFFDIYKKEVRCEEFLIFILLYFYNNNCTINFSIFNTI